MLTIQISLLQNFALLLQIFALLFEMNCTEIDQSQSSIISVYIIRKTHKQNSKEIHF